MLACFHCHRGKSMKSMGSLRPCTAPSSCQKAMLLCVSHFTGTYFSICKGRRILIPVCSGQPRLQQCCVTKSLQDSLSSYAISPPPPGPSLAGVVLRAGCQHHPLCLLRINSVSVELPAQCENTCRHLVDTTLRSLVMLSIL